MVEAASDRSVIQAELKAFAEEQLAKWDQCADKEFKCSDHGFEYTSRQTEYNGCLMTMAKANVPGLTLEQHRAFREDLQN